MVYYTGRGKSKVRVARRFGESLVEKIKLVASDVDGTLLTGSDPNKVSDAEIDAIRELISRDVRFVVASGRQHYNLRRLLAPVADDILYLCEDGSLLMDGNDVLWQSAMRRDDALEVCHAVMEYPGAYLMVNSARTNYCLTDSTWYVDYLQNVVKTMTTPVERPEDIGTDILKIAFYMEAEGMSAALEHFKLLFSDRFNVVPSGATWIDFTSLGTDKGSALSRLGGIVGVDVADMAAFGDNLNDEQMLDVVGHPFLMESGNAELRGLNGRLRLCRSVHGKLAELMDEGLL